MNLCKIKPRAKPTYLNSPSVTTISQTNNIDPNMEICELVNQLKKCDGTGAIRDQLLLGLITACYSNNANQLYLCGNLNVPFREGPIALTAVPQNFIAKSNQLISLFKYLTKIKQSYACWIIYLDDDLGVLNLKLITQFELMEFQGRFSSRDNIVGVFIGKQYFNKARTISTKSECNKFISKLGLSSKPTKDSLNKSSKSKSHKNLKSVSMKEKRTHKHQLSTKLLDYTQTSTHSYKSKGLNSSYNNNKSQSNLKVGLDSIKGNIAKERKLGLKIN